jgi:hemin uptake protein HemP
MMPAWDAKAPSTAPSTKEKPQRVPSSRLLGEAATVEIEHCGQCYVLRVTRENKLILTK